MNHRQLELFILPGQIFQEKLANNVGAGQLPGRADFVVAPRGISRIMFPGLWKMGTYRTDNARAGPAKCSPYPSIQNCQVF